MSLLSVPWLTYVFGLKNTNVGKLFASINLETTRPEQLACDPSEIRKRPKSLLKRMERAVCDKLDIAGYTS